MIFFNNDDNKRLCLLGIAMTLYLTFGALMFQKLEQPVEEKLLKNYWKTYYELEKKIENSSMTLEDVLPLLYLHGNLTNLGYINHPERWNFLGSFHFAVTIVTTIGYGTYTPITDVGRIFVILYGFIGCSGGILFFNIFLERLITILAIVLKAIHVKRIQYLSNGDQIDDEELMYWKPSVYWVTVCLFIFTIIISGLASCLYSYVEEWTLLQSVYFCFVSFSAIGFGDMVPYLSRIKIHSSAYSILNNFILIIGCSFVYALLNVISILMKQMLNFLLISVEKHIPKIWCCKEENADEAIRKFSMSMKAKQRRSTIFSSRPLRKSARSPYTVAGSVERNESSFNDNESENGRKTSSGLISLKDFLTSDHVSLAQMQKELHESAQGRISHHLRIRNSISTGRFIPGTVGPLAILCNKLGGN